MRGKFQPTHYYFCLYVCIHAHKTYVIVYRKLFATKTVLDFQGFMKAEIVSYSFEISK